MEIIINYIISNKIISINKLYKLRYIFKELLNYEPIKEIIKIEEKITDILKYDPDIFDEYYRIRILIKNNLNIHEYLNIKIQTYTTITYIDDMDNDEIKTIKTMEYKYLPLEIQVFMNMYYKYPNPIIKLLPIEIIENQNKINNKLIYSNSIVFIPIMYKYMCDNTIIKILCYCNNLSDNKLGYIHGNDYICFSIISNLEYINQYLEKVTLNISALKKDETLDIIYIGNIYSNSKNIFDCLKELIL